MGRKQKKSNKRERRSFVVPGTNEGEWNVAFDTSSTARDFYADAGTVWHREIGTSLVFCDTKPFGNEYRFALSVLFTPTWFDVFKTNTASFWTDLNSALENGQFKDSATPAADVRDRLKSGNFEAWGTVLTCAANVAYFGEIAELRLTMARPGQAHRVMSKNEIVTISEGTFSPWVIYVPTSVIFALMRDLHDPQ